MPINIRTKGANFERDVATDLNRLYDAVRGSLGLALLDKPAIQRNQNQSAVGGMDLSGPGVFDLAFELKRQESLQVNTWWKQCVASALTLGGKPILIYRQNQQKSSVVMHTYMLSGCGTKMMQVRSEISYEDFKPWYSEYVRFHLASNI